MKKAGPKAGFELRSLAEAQRVTTTRVPTLARS